MRWRVDDSGSYDRVAIVEAELRYGKTLPWLIAWVQSPADSFVEPTDADRAEMLATAHHIVMLHNEATIIEKEK